MTPDVMGETVGTLTVPVGTGFLLKLVRLAVVVGVERVDLVVEPTGPRPGMERGKHLERRGWLRRDQSFLANLGFMLLPRVASTFRSTSIARRDVTWTPVLEEPGVWLQSPVSL